jgi:heme exporter protein A
MVASMPAAEPSAPPQRFNARLVARNLRVKRGGRTILDDIDLSLEPGDVTILRGPNGAGKTTLLRALAGLLRPERGSVTVAGAGEPPLETPERACIYCGPLNAVKAAMSVDENLRFWRALYAAPPERVAGARAAFELDRYADRPAGALSTGLARRLGLARLVVAARPVWLVDEPTISLDTRASEKMFALIHAHSAAGGVALVATHDAIAVAGARTIELASNEARP